MPIQVQHNTNLKNYCTFKTGGPALYFAQAKSAKDMIELRKFARTQNVPYTIIGGGSNVLIADEGYPGLIILNKMTQMQIQGNVVNVEGGVNLMKMLLIAGQHNLGGVSALAGIPGTVGGAVYGNAGTPEVYISDVLTHAMVLPEDREKPIIVGPEYFQFGYRHSKIKKTKDIVLSATLQLKPEPGIKVRNDINMWVKNRRAKQPTGNTCGSFFKNPGQFPSAGWLIEQVGGKWMKEGDAMISPTHANFFMNMGKASTKDILTLALKVHKAVKEKFNIELEPEVQILPVSPFKQ